MALILPFSDQAVIISQGAKIGASSVITIGTQLSTGNPPFPLAVIYSNAGGAPLTNPFFADQDGNFTFWANPGVYLVSVQFGTVLFAYYVTVGAGA